MPEQQLWSEVDHYVAAHLVGADDALEKALADAEAAGLPAIAVSPAQGKLLHLLARSIVAGRILEIGTLAGYSTIWLARAVADGGGVVTLELDERHARVARANLERAGVADRVEVRVGPALESLPRLVDEGAVFDLVFIDADKENIPAYFDHAVGLAHPGTVILVDNVVRGGALVDGGHGDPRVTGVRALHEQLRGREDVSATTIQTVGAKGYDGFTLAVVGPSGRHG